MKKRMQRRRKGFTLMEILLVLAILVILGSIVTVGFVKLQQNAYIDAAKNQIRELGTAVEVYQRDVGKFPSADLGLQALKDPPPDVAQGKWRGPYIVKELPKDPWGNDYVYTQTTTTYGDPSYEIMSNGPDGSNGTADDVFLPQ